MKLVKWEQLPLNMQTDAVKEYYDILEKRKLSLTAKRIFDVCCSVLLLIIMSPVFLVLAVCIKLDSKGPVFFNQERITQYGKTFKIHKFRTMVQNSDKGLQLTVNNDTRITKVGKIIRNCKLDEIPQLINVIKGDLTLVGVRPENPKYVKEYTDEMLATLLLPAGVTNLASIYYKAEAKLLDDSGNADEVYVNKILPSKMYYNLLGLKDFSIISDIKIMFMTFFAVLGKEYKGENIESVPNAAEEVTV